MYEEENRDSLTDLEKMYQQALQGYEEARGPEEGRPMFRH
jgi:hypothetical protein